MPTETPVPTLSPEEIEDVNQRFADFLNGEGEFTDEKIHEMVFRFTGEKSRDLGVVYAQDFDAFVQGVLLYYWEVDIGLVTAIGIKNSEGRRTIIALENPIKFFEETSIWYTVTQYRDNLITDQFDWLYFSNRQEISEYYQSQIGKVGILVMNVNEWVDPQMGYLQKELSANIALKNVINRNTITSMLFSGDFYYGFEAEWINNKGSGLEGITSLEEFVQKTLGNDKLPSFYSVQFFDYQGVS